MDRAKSRADSRVKGQRFRSDADWNRESRIQRSLLKKRAMGFEPTTFGLGSRHSTTELHPRWIGHNDPSRAKLGKVCRRVKDGLAREGRVG